MVKPSRRSSEQRTEAVSTERDLKATDGKVQRKMSLTDFHRVIAVDLRGVFLCAREAAVQMIESGRGGVIINISSISRAGNVGQPTTLRPRPASPR